MVELATHDAYGVLTEPATLTIRRVLPGPIERVWAYLTESGLRRQWQGSGDVSFELEPKGDEVLLTLTHRRLPDRAMLVKVASGWHMHLDLLVARASGAEATPFWDGWNRLREDYERRIPA